MCHTGGVGGTGAIQGIPRKRFLWLVGGGRSFKMSGTLDKVETGLLKVSPSLCQMVVVCSGVQLGKNINSWRFL